MGNLAKGATTPKSIKQAAAKVAKIMDAAESSARRQYNVNKLGVREELDEFFRVVKIVESSNSDYYMVHLVEGTKKYDPFKVSVPILASDLSFNYVGQTYLEEGMTHADVDYKSMVPLLKVADKHLNEESIVDDKTGEPIEYYIYGFQVLRYFVTEKPTEKWSSVDIVDDNGEVLHEGVYLKKRLVRADGSAVDQS